MDYILETKKAMEWLRKQKDTIFLGQTVEYPGSPMFKSLENIPKNRRKEIGVCEDMQMGMSIGLALEGYIPISIYPRMDFLLCAINQLINHLDKVEQTTNGEFQPGVIIRTQIGSTKPLYPGHQHCGDYTNGLKALCKNIIIWRVYDADKIMNQYKNAYAIAKTGKSVILIELPQGGKNPNTYKK